MCRYFYKNNTLSSIGWSGSLVFVVDLSTNPSISWFSPSMEERIGGLIGFTGMLIGLAFVFKENWLSKRTCIYWTYLMYHECYMQLYK